MARVRRSLRTSIALTFALSVALTALALSLAAYYLTKHAEDSRALDEALAQARQNLIIADAMLPEQPTAADYEALMPAFSMRGDFDTLLQVAGETYRSGLEVTADPVTPELDAAVAEGRIRYQTVSAHGSPMIVVGSQFRSDTAILYFFFPQTERLAALAQLSTILIVGGILLAGLGTLAGYLLARRLLRPVREASHAAARMSRGDLDIRLPAGSDEFGALSESFNEMAVNLQNEMLELKAGQAREKRFVADVSHELRTPISALVGEASLLKTKLEAEPAACPVDINRLALLMTQDVARLRQLVDDLLEICRLDSRAVESVIEDVDLDVFFERMIEAHGWSESVHVAGGPGAQSNGGASGRQATIKAPVDRRRLERIMVNFVENALAHGAPPVSLEARATETDDPDRAAMVYVAVTDSGPGIPVHDLPHVFDRFYKADPSRGSSGGSGLGLAIARENARLMGGDVTAANAPGGGARFILSLPSADL